MMYSTTSVNTVVRNTDCFNVKMGLYQGSAISSLLFIMIMDVIAEDIGKRQSHSTSFADDLVLCEYTRKAVEDKLEIPKGTP